MAPLLVIGDTHGNTANLGSLIGHAAQNDCKWIVSVGDFGLWDHTYDGQRFLSETDRTLDELGIDLVFADGNHENHDSLENLVKTGTPNEFGFLPVTPHIFYTPRGNRWMWGGERFLSLGGAHSIDKRWRVDWETKYSQPGTRWWPQEMITEEDVLRCIKGGPADVMITHDSPQGATLGDLIPSYETDRNRAKLRRVVDAVRPKLLIHGHYHRRIKTGLPLEGKGEVHWVEIEGLDCDGSGDDQWLVLNLPD